MLVTMKEILDRASAENYGVAAPNVNTELDARCALEAAEELNAPIILDVGGKEMAFMLKDVSIVRPTIKF